MIVLTKGNSSEEIIVTLNEKRTLDAGFYIFSFTHFTTKEVVLFVVNFSADDSDYPDRYNNFEIDPDSVFGNKTVGQWWYQVNESEDGTTEGTQVECGVMVLNPEITFAPDQYENQETVTVYGG